MYAKENTRLWALVFLVPSFFVIIYYTVVFLCLSLFSSTKPKQAKFVVTCKNQNKSRRQQSQPSKRASDMSYYIGNRLVDSTISGVSR